MKLKDHPAVKRYSKTVEAVSPEVRTLDAAWLRQLCLDCGRRCWVGRDRAPALDDQPRRYPRLPAANQDIDQLRVPHESRADSVRWPVRWPIWSSHRSTIPTRSRRIVGCWSGRNSGRESGRGLSDGNGQVSPARCGQPTSRWPKRRAWVGWAASQRHSSQVRQFHSAGNDSDRRPGHGLRSADRLQSLPGVQAVRGGLPGGGHLT